MKQKPGLILVLLVLALGAGGCLPEPEPAIDEATVVNDNTSVRLDGRSTARTLFTLNRGERVSIIEKRDNWFRVRDAEQIEGWMEESTIVRDATREAMSGALAQAASMPVQNTALAREDVNLRLEPGRDTAIVRRLPRGTRIEVLDREVAPRPASDALDVWLQVRPSEDEIGWVFSQLTAFETPQPLLPFTEGRTYTAVRTLKEVEDPGAGLVRWYVVGERRTGADPRIAFDGVRVFTWNTAAGRYETTLRLGGLDGVYPIEITGSPEEPGFRIHLRGPDGARSTREFVMRGTVPREVR